MTKQNESFVKIDKSEIFIKRIVATRGNNSKNKNLPRAATIKESAK